MNNAVCLKNYLNRENNSNLDPEAKGQHIINCANQISKIMLNLEQKIILKQKLQGEEMDIEQARKHVQVNKKHYQQYLVTKMTMIPRESISM